MEPGKSKLLLNLGWQGYFECLIKGTILGKGRKAYLPIIFRSIKKSVSSLGKKVFFTEFPF